MNYLEQKYGYFTGDFVTCYGRLCKVVLTNGFDANYGPCLMLKGLELKNEVIMFEDEITSGMRHATEEEVMQWRLEQ